MSLFKDILPIVKKHVLIFDQKQQESRDIFTFEFHPEKPLKWMAGQHGIFFITHKKINKPFRPFSLASSPLENKVIISFRVSDDPSPFKEAMMSLDKGEKIIMRGPVGGFYLKEDKAVLCITGGIGITPYRSIIKDQVLNQTKRIAPIELLYIDTQEAFIYESDFKEAQKKLNFRIHYLSKKRCFT